MKDICKNPHSFQLRENMLDYVYCVAAAGILGSAGEHSVSLQRKYCGKGEIMSKIFKFHNDVDTDQIIASQYLLLPSVEDMKGYTFESLDGEFAGKVKPGDIIAAGENFGCGSSREQAPSVLKALGVKAVVAKSFARIFYRNAINIGLPVLVSKDFYDAAKAEGDAQLDLAEGTIEFEGVTYTCTKLPPYMQNILNQGGLIASLNKNR